jgi:glycosyltransferase involved in cell wall biosynthesis
MKPRILHVSTVHHPADPRLALRVMPTLASDYALTAVLPSFPGVTAPEGVRVWPVPYLRKLWWRLLISYPLVLFYALRLRPVLVHLYDPELIPIGLLLKTLLRVPVVLEVHENLHKKLDQKARIHGDLSLAPFRWFDALARQHFFLILTEHGYHDTYTNLTEPSVVIYNYPQLAFLEPFRMPYCPTASDPALFYIGGLSLERAFDTMVAALALLTKQYPNIKLHLIGRQLFTDKELRALPDYATVRDNLVLHGYTEQRHALHLAAGATAGVALWKPVGDHTDSYPTKLFEYMALSLPVLTADLPLCRAIVETHDCGICVSPTDALAVADALAWLIAHPDEARQMGERGRRTVETQYNWESEAAKLREFYQMILPV